MAGYIGENRERGACDFEGKIAYPRDRARGIARETANETTLPVTLAVTCNSYPFH